MNQPEVVSANQALPAGTNRRNTISLSQYHLRKRVNPHNKLVEKDTDHLWHITIAVTKVGKLRGTYVQSKTLGRAASMDESNESTKKNRPVKLTIQ
jgi:hypothetical protein